jgi:hypothetical protein
MSALIRLFWDICTFKRGPQDIPYSSALFALLLIINFVYNFSTLLIPDNKGATHSPGEIIAYLLVDAIVSIGIVLLILWTHHRFARSLQTLTALSAADLIIGIADLPFLILASTAGNQVNLIFVFYLGFMVLLIWQLAVYTHILRHALSGGVFQGGGYALLLFVLSLLVHSQMLPVVR